MKTLKRTLILAALFALAGCNTSTKPRDMGSEPDLATPPCVMNPMTATDILNACTTSQTGDPTKSYPYFPSLAPGGKLPSLP
jgi:hypothetical protein